MQRRAGIVYRIIGTFGITALTGTTRIIGFFVMAAAFMKELARKTQARRAVAG